MLQIEADMTLINSTRSQLRSEIEWKNQRQSYSHSQWSGNADITTKAQTVQTHGAWLCQTATM